MMNRQQQTDILLQMMIAPDLDKVTRLALDAVMAEVHPQAAAVLLWDIDLGRYIIGAVEADHWEHGPAHYRREVLHIADDAFNEDRWDARCIAADVFYQPLNTPDGNHIGALIYTRFDRMPAVETGNYQLMLRCISRALWTMTHIDRTDHEHSELMADRERLSQLLRAVEQQQHTIDHLLAMERQLSASLEAKVEERTAALREAQTRLIQSEKLAVIGQLASSLAHEINNPLQAVQSGLGLAIAELESGQMDHVHADLTVIQAELERIQAIFRQMLDFNRPVSHESRPLNLNAICEGVHVLLRKKLEQADIKLHLELARSLPSTCGDGNQIKQVLINLVLNAAEAMPATGGTIIIRTSRGERRVYIAVIDDGRGIQPEHRARLFEPLFTTKTRGLGLGLAISREIIQRHNGEITAESIPGDGALFRIALPEEEVCHDDEC